MLQNKKILIAVTGSIAAYKIAHLTRLLVKKGAFVKVIMTEAATQFISPLTLSTLSKNKVLTRIFAEEQWANHVMLGRWADVMMVAPLSCNTLSKMASGACDNLLMAVYLSATCPVVVVPAMDEDMWHHPATLKNISAIEAYGNKVIPVNNGELASGLVGDGRMAEPEEIQQWLELYFEKDKELSGKKVLVTAGPTHEALDPVRFIGNASSGKMGIAIATELAARGAEVKLVIGPTAEKIPVFINTVHVVNAADMYEACVSEFEKTDWVIMSAAVADYTPVKTAKQKIKKADNLLAIELKKTVDILSHLGKIKKDSQCLVGFALETNDEKENAQAKLKNKNADMIVLNSLRDEGAGFGTDTNKITIFDKKGGTYEFETRPKSVVAADIVNAIIKYVNE